MQRVKDLRTVALRHVTRQINKMKPLLADFSNSELVSFEMEDLNNVLDEVIDNDSDISSVNSWYEVHDGDVLRFKQSV